MYVFRPYLSLFFIDILLVLVTATLVNENIPCTNERKIRYAQKSNEMNSSTIVPVKRLNLLVDILLKFVCKYQKLLLRKKGCQYVE